MKKKGEAVKRYHWRQGQRRRAVNGPHLGALMEYEPVEFREGHRNFVVASDIDPQIYRSEIVDEAREELCALEFEFDFLAQFAAQRFEFVLSVIHSATEQAPVTRVPDAWDFIAPL